MRGLFREALLVALVSTVAASAALGLLPGEGTWATRTVSLIVTAATLDFTSTMARQPVLQATAHAALWSAALVGVTALLLLVVGVPLGMVSATRSQSPVVRAVRVTVDTISSLPVLLWSTLLFALLIRTFGIELSADVNPVQTLAAAIIAILLGDRVLADIVRRVEIRTKELLAEPWMQTVRAGRLGVRRHLLQGLVPAVAESISSRAMFLVGGAIVAERVFGIDGLGYLVTGALERNQREPQLILALSLALVAIGLAFRILTRIAIRLADPRTAS
jgi:peptide/nickel transport system permease protein